MPVPTGRGGLDYFEALKHLDVGKETKLYLGLVHAIDEEGTWRRIATAQTVREDFGVATECGMGRTPTEELESILKIAKNLTRPATCLG